MVVRLRGDDPRMPYRDAEESPRWLEQARNPAARVAQDDDRELLLSDLETVPAVR